jgi:hypothetical protein
MVTCCWVAAVLLLLLLLLLSAALLGGPLVAVWYARQLARLARQRLASVEVGVLHAHIHKRRKDTQSQHWMSPRSWLPWTTSMYSSPI